MLAGLVLLLSMGPFLVNVVRSLLATLSVALADAACRRRARYTNTSPSICTFRAAAPLESTRAQQPIPRESFRDVNSTCADLEMC